LYSGILRRVIWWNLSDVSEVLTASIIRAVTHHDDTKRFSLKFLHLVWNLFARSCQQLIRVVVFTEFTKMSFKSGKFRPTEL
jgi:hypothetical protein